VVSATESYYLEGEGLLTKVGGTPKSDRQVDLPKGYDPLPRHDAMEGCSAQAKLGPIDSHGVDGLGVHGVEAATSIHNTLVSRALPTMGRQQASTYPVVGREQGGHHGQR
jgi:hypothetical protein